MTGCSSPFRARLRGEPGLSIPERPKAAPPLPPGSGGTSVPAPGWTEPGAHLDTEGGSAASWEWGQVQGLLVPARRPGRTRVRARRGAEEPPPPPSPGLGVWPPSPPPPRGDADTTTRRPLRGVKRPLGSAGVGLSHLPLPGADRHLPGAERAGPAARGSGRASPRRRPAGLGPGPRGRRAPEPHQSRPHSPFANVLVLRRHCRRRRCASAELCLRGRLTGRLGRSGRCRP